MNAPGWPEKGWHYRRSLASRVILLTTIAVGFAVALVALAVFLTVRMQMQSSLDQSLLLAWPQVVILVALTIFCFAAAYVVFLRQEVRA